MSISTKPVSKRLATRLKKYRVNISGMSCLFQKPPNRLGRLFEKSLVNFPEQCETDWVAKNGCRYRIAWSNTLIDDRGVKYVISTGINITERKQAEAELETRARQQAVVAHLGQQALAQTNLEALLEEAVIITARTLDVEYSRALELLPHKTELRLKAGFGWQEDIPFISAERESQVAYTLTSQTVVIDDLRRETRFVTPSVLRKQRA